MAARILVTGATGVLGRELVPLLEATGHDVVDPSHYELDLFDGAAVRRAATGAHAIYHLATRIPRPERAHDREAWRENDRLREEAARLLVDAALAADVVAYVQPTIAFVYPDGPADEETAVDHVDAVLASALAAERETARFAAAGRRGVVLRLGLLDGPGTGSAMPDGRFGATLHVSDAGAALLAASRLPSGIYNVVRDGERVANARFKGASGWRPTR